MDNEYLMTFVKYYSLLRRKLFDNEDNIIKYCPKNVFGVFSAMI